MKQEKVLILITKSNWGGAQRYVFDLATRLPKDRFKVEVMAGGEGPLLDRLRAAGIAADGSLEMGRDISIFEDIAAFFRLISLLRKKKPAILHLNSSKIGGLGALAGVCARVPRIIFTAHGWAFNEDRPFYEKIAIRAAYWLTIFLSDQTITVSEMMKQQVRIWPLVSQKVAVIHNGIAAEAAFSQANARFALASLHPGLKKASQTVHGEQPVWIGTIAELHPIKGYEYAIRAIGECVKDSEDRNIHKKLLYIIIGEGNERQKIAALIKELGLEEHIFLLGHIDSAAQYLKAFDLFLLASLSEGLGYVLLEAGLAQTTVVATAVGGIPEIIEDMRSGILVQPRKYHELAYALTFLIEHPAERRLYGAALKERVSKAFSLEKMVIKTEEAYGLISAR